MSVRRCMTIYTLAMAFGVSADEVKLPPMHHPVEIAIPASMTIPQALPLGDHGELICDSCHGLDDIEKIPLDEVDTQVPDFLRLGPYRQLTDFCYRCHEKARHERYNIHRMLDEEGRLDERGCVYCHRETPDRNRAYDSEELAFQLPREKLCYGCHLKTPHLNALNHLVEPDDAIRENLREAEVTHQVSLPLDDRGWITCITCHSPHPLGVIDRERPAGQVVEDHDVADGIAYARTAWSVVFAKDKAQRLQEMKGDGLPEGQMPEYLRVEKELLLRLRAKDGTLCLSCHEFED